MPSLLALVLVVGCAAEPVDPWLGSFDMQIDERQWPCDDPAAVPVDASSDRTWMIERVDADTFRVPGLCSFEYSVVTSTRAELAPRTCDVTLDSGARASVELIDGTLNRDGNHVWGTQRVVVMFDTGTCVRAAADVAGDRF